MSFKLPDGGLTVAHGSAGYFAVIVHNGKRAVKRQGSKEETMGYGAQRLMAGVASLHSPAGKPTVEARIGMRYLDLIVNDPTLAAVLRAAVRQTNAILEEDGFKVAEGDTAVVAVFDRSGKRVDTGEAKAVAPTATPTAPTDTMDRLAAGIEAILIHLAADGKRKAK